MVGRTKYMSRSEVAQLREKARLWALDDLQHGRRRGDTAWLLVDLVLATGLRVGELSDIQIEDFDWTRGFLTIRRLKKRGMVQQEPLALDRATLDHVKEYLAGRTTGPLFIGQRGPMKFRGLQELWLSAIKRAGLPHYSIHAGRHTIAVFLLRKTGNLRVVQKQLGHKSPTTTANMYADVSFEDMAKAVSGLYKDE